MPEYDKSQQRFTSKQAVDLFRQHTGFEFHPTVPGQLLARLGIQKIASTSPSQFASGNWELVWEEMFLLALRRCRFDPALVPPRKCFAPPLPLGVPIGPVELTYRPDPTRCFIDVPFAEKDEAKSLGAQWDPALKKWYIPAGLNRQLFRWNDARLPQARRKPEGVSPVASATKRKTKKKRTAPGNSRSSTRRLNAELDARLDYLLDKPD